MVCAMGLMLGFAPLTLMAAKNPPPPPVIVTTTVFKLGQAGEGRKRVNSTDQHKPGDILIYRASYRNETKGLLKDVVATMPVPSGLIYIADSGVPPPARATKDGKTFFLMTEAPQDAPLSTWRAIRWAPREIGPLSETFFELRVRVPGSADQ